MKKLLIILSVTLGLTTTAQAKRLWQCDMMEGQITRFEDKLVGLQADGSVVTFNCIKDLTKANVLNKDICVWKDDMDDLAVLIFEPSNKVPSKVSGFSIESEGTISEESGLGVIKLENCKEF